VDLPRQDPFDARKTLNYAMRSSLVEEEGLKINEEAKLA
jgi:hypothetical protein